MDKFDINYGMLQDLRDFMNIHRRLDLRMRYYVSETTEGFCATSACLAGWGAMMRLALNHPVLVPFYTKLDEWNQRFPVKARNGTAHTLLGRLSAFYSWALIQPFDADVSEIAHNINRVLSTLNDSECQSFTELYDYLDEVLDSDPHHEELNAPLDGNPAQPVWHFIFGAQNPNNIDHAIWRMDYVLEHQDIPFIYFRDTPVGSNTRLLELKNAINTAPELKSLKTINLSCGAMLQASSDNPSARYEEYIDARTNTSVQLKDLREYLRSKGDIVDAVPSE